MNKINYIEKTLKVLADLENKRIINHKISELLSYFLYQKINVDDNYFYDSYLYTLISDNIAFNQKSNMGYIDYLKGCLINLDNPILVSKVYNFVKLIELNIYRKNLKSFVKNTN